MKWKALRMPYDIKYLDDGGVITTYRGIVTDEDILESVKEKCSSAKKLASLRYAVTDCTDVAEFQVTPQGMIENANISKRAAVINRELLVVGVYPDDLSYGMGRLWQGYADITGWSSIVVRTKQEAEQWLEDNLS